MTLALHQGNTVGNGIRTWGSRKSYCRPVPKGLGGGQPVTETLSIRGVYDNRKVSMVYALQKFDDEQDISLNLTVIPVLIVGIDGAVRSVDDAEPTKVSAIGLPGTRHSEDNNFKKAPPYVIVSRNEGGGISVERYEMPDKYLQHFPPEHRGTGLRIPLYV